MVPVTPASSVDLLPPISKDGHDLAFSSEIFVGVSQENTGCAGTFLSFLL